MNYYPIYFRKGQIDRYIFFIKENQNEFHCQYKSLDNYN